MNQQKKAVEIQQARRKAATGFGIAALALLLAGCNGNPKPEGPETPDARPTPVDFSALVAGTCPQLLTQPLQLFRVIKLCNVPNKSAVVSCIADICAGLEPPTPAPTVATPVPSAAPTVAPTSAPHAIETAVPVGGICQETHAGAVVEAEFADTVEAVQRIWIDQNPDKWKPSGLGGSQFNVKEEYRDSYQFDIVRGIRGAGFLAVVEANGHGTPNGSIAVAWPVAPAFDSSFHEGYSVMVSSRDIRFPFNGNKPNGFMGRCEPRGFELSEKPGEFRTPTANPSKTSNGSPTPTLSPPTLSHFNGCNPPNAQGRCEFAQWYDQFKIPADRPQPPCAFDQCPGFWRPSGMALTCDHQFTDEGVAAGVYEPRAGRWVSVMWYVCAGRVWDDPRGPMLITSGNVVCDQPGWKRGGGFDMFNAVCSGVGTVTVCSHPDAFACIDPTDYTDRRAETYGAGEGQTPHCPSGTIPLHGAGSCRGPFAVGR